MNVCSFLALMVKGIQCLYFSNKDFTEILMQSNFIPEHVKYMCLRLSSFLNLRKCKYPIINFFFFVPFVLEPPKPFNLTSYTLKDNLKLLNVMWYTFGNPQFFTLLVCKLKHVCYEKVMHNVTRNYSNINQWIQQLNMSLETGRHQLYIESHSSNMSVTSTTEFIIGKNSQSF